MGRLFVRGDAHGDYDFLENFCRKYKTTEDDILVILGDCGILYGFAPSRREELCKRFISDYPITLFCVRGNHDCRPDERNLDLIYSNRFNGKVYNEKDFPKIFYAVDGEDYKINEKRILTIGGAYSIDKFARLAYGYYWNPREMLSPNEMDRISMDVAGEKFDYVFTHTCPYSWMPSDLFIAGAQDYGVDDSMEHWLQYIMRSIQFNKWYFGHFHANRAGLGDYGKGRLLYDEIEILD